MLVMDHIVCRMSSVCSNPPCDPRDSVAIVTGSSFGCTDGWDGAWLGIEFCGVGVSDLKFCTSLNRRLRRDMILSFARLVVLAAVNPCFMVET